jgi:hypothetical protein
MAPMVRHRFRVEEGLAQIRVQSPLYLSPHSLPLPDLLLPQAELLYHPPL